MAIIDRANRQSRRELKQALGPQLTFLAAVLLTATVLATAVTLAKDSALLIISALLFVLAALVSLLAWRSSSVSRNTVSYWDVAGALVLIGAFAGTMLEPEQVVRLLDGGADTRSAK